MEFYCNLFHIIFMLSSLFSCGLMLEGNILFQMCVFMSSCSITDTYETFILSLLSSLLVSGPNSPFYKALIDARIGTDFAPVVG